MFTGIIEATGTVSQVIDDGGNRSFWIHSPLSGQLRVDQSLSHNGVCLTVEETRDGMHRVTAIHETLLKTNLGDWTKGDLINMERCLPMNGRIDGHIVQGHVDCTATCVDIKEKDGSWEYRFRFPPEFAALVIEKGSVCLNGISLTCFDLDPDHFTVAIIPFTYEHTNMNRISKGDRVNIEWDILGKYINRKIAVTGGSSITRP